MSSRFFLVSLVLITVLAGIYNIVFAQDSDFIGVQDFTVQRIARIITGFACWLIGIVLAIMVVFLVWSGIRFFWARGNETAVGDAKKNLTWTLVGILVILATNVIIATVANALQPGLNYRLLPLNCPTIATVTTQESLKSCTGQGQGTCPDGSSCFIPENQTEGICIDLGE